MRALISFYLLLTWATRQKFTWSDIWLARYLSLGNSTRNKSDPDWLSMIINMKQEAPLPEAFNDWRCDIDEWIREFPRRLLGKS